MEERAGPCPRARGALGCAVSYWPHHEPNWPVQLVAVCCQRSVAALLLPLRGFTRITTGFSASASAAIWVQQKVTRCHVWSRLTDELVGRLTLSNRGLRAKLEVL